MVSKIAILASALTTLVTASNIGVATFFYGTVSQGACADQVSSLPWNMYGVALADPNWDDFSHCGAKIAVTGPNGVTVHAVIIDRCMGCAWNGLDLYPDAFDQLADPAVGRIPVSWDWV